MNAAEYFTDNRIDDLRATLISALGSKSSIKLTDTIFHIVFQQVNDALQMANAKHKSKPAASEFHNALVMVNQLKNALELTIEKNNELVKKIKELKGEKASARTDTSPAKHPSYSRRIYDDDIAFGDYDYNTVKVGRFNFKIPTAKTSPEKMENISSSSYEAFVNREAMKKDKPAEPAAAVPISEILEDSYQKNLITEKEFKSLKDLYDKLNKNLGDYNAT